MVNVFAFYSGGPTDINKSMQLVFGVFTKTTRKQAIGASGRQGMADGLRQQIQPSTIFAT
jgi:hypothetical protein